MNQNPNPVRKHGSRNLFCPFYSDCLDHAAKRHWESWACFNCHHQVMRGVGMEGPFSTGDSSPYYSISPEIYLRAV
ncbi:MAG: hypothetical protein KKH68_14250 [Proteobacteria bacterium]|nr:hypothetical protein [Pseudomonadota bacterium]